MRTLDNREEIDLFIEKPFLQDNPPVEETVRHIIADVRERGDAAVFDYIRRFDWPDADSLVVTGDEIDYAYTQISMDLLDAIQLAAENIERFHRKQLRDSWLDREQDGRLLGQMIRPLARVGVLAPGLQAPLPSSVLMGAIPARVAGVREVYLCTPPRKDGSVHPAMLVAAAEAQVNGILRIGGAHGVAALAWGTETVPRVDKIVGPGNVYVTMAKRFVFGQVGIDMLAGPSEVVVLADETANPRFAAADLLAQAEHDPDARAILVTTSPELAGKVSAEVERQLPTLARADVARKSLDANGAILLTESLGAAVELVNKIAPEHLIVSTASPLELLDSIENAGAIFLGEYTTESVGDYTAGPNHVLPTSGTARFSSPLTVDDFIKKSSVLMYSKENLMADAPATVQFAEAEGLDAHANAVRVRLE
ncbi:MAG: histidinol dehydrogenase [Armatimonadota bacterium]